MGSAAGSGVPYDQAIDDAELVQAAIDGDKDAFASIYDRYAARLHDFLFSVVRDRDGAADLLQDTFVLAGTRLHQLRDPSKLRPWLYAIARHLALRDLKRRSRQEPLGDTEVTAGEDGDGGTAEARELSDLVWAAAEGLNARDRVALDLHLRQGMEGAALGEALGVSTNQAYVIMSRLRDQVERSLGALLVARHGRRDCAELSALLEPWDGTFSTVWRKRVARHADSCATCSDSKRRVGSALAIFGATPAMALPGGLRDRILGEIQLVSHTGKPWSADGFPPGLRRGPGRKTMFAVAAGLIVLLLVGGALAGAFDTSGSGRLVSAGSASTSATSPGPANGPTTTTSMSPKPTPASGQPSTTSVPSAGEPSGSAPPATATPAAPIATTTVLSTPAASTPAASTTAPSTTAPSTPAASTTAPSTPAASTTAVTGTTLPTTTTTRQATTTTRPLDRLPPTIGSLTVDPSTLSAGSHCRSSAPTTARVSITATDSSGIASVVVEWDRPTPGSAAMSPQAGNRWDATIGPFSDVTAGSVEISLAVIVTDAAGNQAAAGGIITVECPR